jgi:AraC-like DNA-binding protein
VLYKKQMWIIFNIFFFSTILFCTYVTFAQWSLSRDIPSLFYIGYLLFTFGHYGRQFWIEGFMAGQFVRPPDPPFQWDSPLSYAAFACYFLFIERLMAMRDNAPRLSAFFENAARFLMAGIVVHLLLQRFWGIQTADLGHQIFQAMLFPIMILILVYLFRYAKIFYEKLILFGSLALVIGFLSVLGTRHYERRDLIENVICCFPEWPWCCYHLKVGIIIDVICFSWALTLRQKMLLSTTKVITEKVVVLPLDIHTEDDLLGNVNTWLAAHFHRESLTVPELAQAIFLAPDALTKKIKVKTGLTTEQYILRYRLERALEMLGSTRLNISEIAFATGFREAAHFSRAFKRHYGQTPGDMRRSIRPKNG